MRGALDDAARHPDSAWEAERSSSRAVPGSLRSGEVACGSLASRRTMKLYDDYKAWVCRNNVALNLLETGVWMVLGTWVFSKRTEARAWTVCGTCDTLYELSMGCLGV